MGSAICITIHKGGSLIENLMKCQLNGMVKHSEANLWLIKVE
jgi:hypothetical protein